MSPEFLVTGGVRREEGVSPVSNVSGVGALRITLGITRIVERESLEVVIEGASDVEDWRPMLKFPRKFYCGTYSQYWSASGHPGVTRIRARWRMERWHGSAPAPLFEFSVAVETFLARKAAAGERGLQTRVYGLIKVAT